MVKTNIQPAATVILLREKGTDMNLLLLHRNRSLSFFGGTWVFPGGKVEKTDFENASTEKFIDVARLTAIREVKEETGLTIHGDDLRPFSHWTTPEGMTRRFKTWFFYASVNTSEVVVDHQEITGYQWLSPEKAIEVHAASGLPLSPPTYVSLNMVSVFKRMNRFTPGNKSFLPVVFTPKPLPTHDGTCFLYEGDAGYEEENQHRTGSRHRLWVSGERWCYERSVWE